MQHYILKPCNHMHSGIKFHIEKVQNMTKKNTKYDWQNLKQKIKH